MTGYAFSKTKFEKDFYSWGNEEEKAEYKEDIKDPCFWVNEIDGHPVSKDWTVVSPDSICEYSVDKDWCEEVKEN